MIGERLKMARAMAGLTMRDLAQRARVSHQAIGKYEKGTATPSSQVLIRLSKALGVRMEFLMRPKVVELSEVEFRKKKSAPRKNLAAIEATVRDRIERYALAESFFPEENQPRLTHYELTDVEDAEDKAKAWRKAWKLGWDPIENLVETAEAHGIKVVLIDAPEGFDGLAVWIDEEIPCLVVNDNLSECRFRLTFAHEMGHIVASGIEDWPEKRQEDAAFRLGAAFLVPDETAYAELGEKRRTLDWAELITLKQVYGLSIQAWIVRAAQLGIISEAAKAQLFRRLGKRGWRKEEPGDKQTQERSYRFARLLLRAVTEDCISEERAAEIYGESLDAFRRKVTEGRLNAACPDH
jgi:Zn-dependent peptidase ImmA (M78 family)